MDLSREVRLTSAEAAVFSLRSLYESCGYGRFKVNKFEEYDFYASCKSFLMSENVLTFTDSTGRLMALKPDITLSIVKNVGASGDGPQKVYYNESVFRDSGDGNGFREITQTGLERVGEVDTAAVCEAVELACRSLDLLRAGKSAVLDLSHVGVVSAILDAEGVGEAARGAVASLMGDKNAGELMRAAAAAGISAAGAEKLCRLATLYGTPDEVRGELYAAAGDVPGCAPALEELYAVVASLPDGLGRMLRFDFSAAGDMKYYTGAVFRGYIDGIPRSVLSGGRYGGLLPEYGAAHGGIGFAVYTDLLEYAGGGRGATLVFDDPEVK